MKLPRKKKPQIEQAAAEPVPKDSAAEIVRLHAERFVNPPPGAEGGLYAPVGGFASALFDIADGAYRVKGGDWTFSFKGGRLIQATHKHRKALIPGAVTEI